MRFIITRRVKIILHERNVSQLNPSRTQRREKSFFSVRLSFRCPIDFRPLFDNRPFHWQCQSVCACLMIVTFSYFLSLSILWFPSHLRFCFDRASFIVPSCPSSVIVDQSIKASSCFPISESIDRSIAFLFLDSRFVCPIVLFMSLMVRLVDRMGCWMVVMFEHGKWVGLHCW